MTKEDIISKPNKIRTVPVSSKSQRDMENGKRSRWYRIQLTGYLRSLPIKICNHTFLTTLVLTNNCFRTLPIEICNLTNLINLDVSSNYLYYLPEEMGYMFQLQTLLMQFNKLVELPVTFGFLHNLQTLDLRYNPLNGYTLYYYDYSNVRRLIKFLMDQYFVINHLDAPPTREVKEISEYSAGFPFTLMCYNVLCQYYATGTMFPYCPSYALDWEYRKRAILDEIFAYKADIICLQELETSQFENVFLAELQKRGYEGIFVPKSRSRTMHEAASQCVDGCAIFWNTECFQMIHHFKHEFMMSCNGLCKNPTPVLLNRVMNRDNVALSVILEVKDNHLLGRRICVSTGHIHWDPLQSDVKVIQTLFWTAELWNYIREFYKNENSDRSPNEMPVILCGDFNSLPHSAVIDYLFFGKVGLGHPDFQDYGDKYLIEEWAQINDEFLENNFLKHHFNFGRAYNDRSDDGLTWSNYTMKFRGVIDHIFYSRDRLKLLKQLKQIPESWFTNHNIVGVPHIHLGSDHFSLLVQFELTVSADSPEPINTQLSLNNDTNINKRNNAMTTGTISNNIQELRRHRASLATANTPPTIR